MLLRIFVLFNFISLNCTYLLIDRYEAYRSSDVIDVAIYIFNSPTEEILQVDHVSVWSQISHCNTMENDDEFSNKNNRKFPFRLGTGFVGYDRKLFYLTRCLHENKKWMIEKSFDNCTIFENIVDFTPILGLSDEEIIVISCKTPFKEFIKEVFVSDYPKIQSRALYSAAQRLLNENLPKIYLPNGAIIWCVSNFPFQTYVQWRRLSISFHDDYIFGQKFVVNIIRNQNKNYLQNQLNEYTCDQTYVSQNITQTISVSFVFYVQVLYNVTVMDSYGNINRTEFDVGETIRCSIGSKYRLDNVLWRNPNGVIKITYNDTISIQSNTGVITLQPQPSLITPINAILECIVEGESPIPYIVFSTNITILTNSFTVINSKNDSNPLTPYKNMSCQNQSDSIFLYFNLYKELPLSKFISKCKRINNSADFKVSIPVDFKWEELYFVVCITKENIAKAPLEINPSKIDLLYIRPIYPDFIKNTEYQMKGFIYECLTQNADYRVEWGCPTCAIWQYQKLTYTNSDENAQNIEIITNENMQITYECVSKYDNITVTKKFLSLNIIGGLIPTLTKPYFFYSPNDPVICLGRQLNFDISESIKIILPTKIVYTNNYNDIFEKSTTPDIDPYNISTWSPKIPSIFNNKYENIEWKFKGCCLKYSNESLTCGSYTELKVIRDYDFVYNFPIKLNEFYAGDIIKCCIVTQYYKIIDDTNSNADKCIPARMELDGEKSTVKHLPLSIQGFQIKIPEIFKYYDIETTTAFVSCYAEDFGRKEFDLQRTRRVILIKSCVLSPPPIEMIPVNDSVFYANETIQCATIGNKCKDVLKFDFTIEKDSKILGFYPNTKELILTREFMGNNIQITCKTGISDVRIVRKIISINMVPSNITFKGLKRIMIPNQEIICLFDASLPYRMIWKQISGPDPLLVVGPRILIRNLNQDGTYVFTCIVSNNHGKIKESISFEIFNTKQVSTFVSYKFYIYIYFHLIFYHLILMLVAYFIFQEYFHTTSYLAKSLIPKKSGTVKSKKE